MNERINLLLEKLNERNKKQDVIYKICRFHIVRRTNNLRIHYFLSRYLKTSLEACLEIKWFDFLDVKDRVLSTGLQLPGAVLGANRFALVQELLTRDPKYWFFRNQKIGNPKFS